MQSLLLDTHTLLWTFFEPEKLSNESRDTISDPKNVVHVSLVSIWEISIKQSIGRLSIPDSFFDEVFNQGFERLDLDLKSIQLYKNLPLHHRDPFDRILVAQAKGRQLTLVTRDPEIRQYEVSILKA